MVLLQDMGKIPEYLKGEEIHRLTLRLTGSSKKKLLKVKKKLSINEFINKLIKDYNGNN